MKNCWRKHWYSNRWKWAWSNYISSFMFNSWTFVLENRWKKDSSKQLQVIQYNVALPSIKNSLSSVSPSFILRLLLLRQPHHPPPVLLLQLLDQLLLSPDLLPLPPEILVLPGVKSHLALDVLVDLLGRACSLNKSKYVLIWIFAAHNLFNRQWQVETYTCWRQSWNKLKLSLFCLSGEINRDWIKICWYQLKLSDNIYKNPKVQ